MSAPRKIWLQEPVGLPGEEERSWCVEPQSDMDDLYHHDDVVRELVEASQALLDEKDDYMRRNNLGDPMKETVSARVRAALAKIAQEG